jgi:hypothetical protein
VTREDTGLQVFPKLGQIGSTYNISYLQTVEIKGQIIAQLMMHKQAETLLN